MLDTVLPVSTEHFEQGRKHVKVPFNTVYPCIRNVIAWLKGLLASSPALPSDRGTTKVKVKMKNWWNDIDSGNPTYTEKILSQCHFVRQNLIWTRPESKSDLRVWRPVAKRARHATALNTEIRPYYIYKSIPTSEKKQLPYEHQSRNGIEGNSCFLLGESLGTM
jgi:hypothetical protein